MKRIFLSLLIFLLLFCFTSCNNAFHKTENAISQTVKDLKSDEYVKDMEISGIEGIKLPIINEELLNFELVSQFNNNTRNIYNEIENLSAGFYFTSDYEWTIKDNILSLCLKYKTDKSPYMYNIINIDILSGKAVPLSKLYSLTGFSSSEIRGSVKLFIEATLKYLEENNYNSEKHIQLEEAFENSLILYDTSYSSETLNAYLDNNGLVLILPVYNLLDENNPNYYTFRPSKNSYNTAMNFPSDEILATVINHVTKEEKAISNIIEEVILPPSASETNEPILFVAAEDNTVITINSGTTDIETWSYIPTKTLLNKTLKKGEAVYIETIRPEIRPPEIRVTIQRDDLFGQYFISFDGRFGNLKLEYIKNTKPSPDWDSSMSDLAVSRIISTSEANDFNFNNNELSYWNSIVLSVSKYHRPTNVVNGKISISEDELKRYAFSLFPEQKTLIPLSDNISINLGIYYDEKSKLYNITNFFPNNINYTYKALPEETGLNITVSNSNTKDEKSYNVFLEELKPYDSNELIKYYIKSIELLSS